MLKVYSGAESSKSRGAIDAPSGGKTILQFVGAGDIQKSLSEGSDFAANTGVGVIFIRDWEDQTRLVSDFNFDFAINVASTVDTIKAEFDANNNVTNTREFGSYILLPMNSGQAVKFSMNAYFGTEKWGVSKIGKRDFKKPVSLFSVINGVSIDFIGSNRAWSINDATTYATGFLFQAGLFHDFVPNDIRNEKGYSIKFGVAYTFRGIYGDAGFDTEDAQQFRRTVLNSNDRQFHGYEFGMSFRLKNIEAKVSMPRLFVEDNSIPGLSNTQFITSISFIGGFPLDLKKEVKE